MEGVVGSRAGGVGELDLGVERGRGEEEGHGSSAGGVHIDELDLEVEYLN